MPTDYEMSDIRQALSRLENSSGRVEGLLEGHIAEVTKHFAATDDRLNKQDSRIRKIEVNQGRYAGGASVLGAIGGWISYHFWPHL